MHRSGTVEASIIEELTEKIGVPAYRLYSIRVNNDLLILADYSNLNKDCLTNNRLFPITLNYRKGIFLDSPTTIVIGVPKIPNNKYQLYMEIIFRTVLSIYDANGPGDPINASYEIKKLSEFLSNAVSYGTEDTTTYLDEIINQLTTDHVFNYNPDCTMSSEPESGRLFEVAFDGYLHTNQRS